MKKRRLSWIAACGIAALMLLLGLIHTPALRKAVLARVISHLRQSSGIVLDVKNFNYNLISPWVHAEGVSLQNSDPTGFSFSLAAEKVHLRFRFGDLIRGSFRVHELRVTGLRLGATLRKSGNAAGEPRTDQTPVRGSIRLPVDRFEITDCFLSITDGNDRWQTLLPGGNIRGSLNSSTGDQDIEYALNRKGSVRWGETEIPVDNLELNLRLQEHAITLKTLHAAGTGFEAEAGGTLQDPGLATLNVSAQVRIDGASLSPLLKLRSPFQGRIRSEIRLSGSAESPVLEGDLRSDELDFGGFRWSSLGAQGRYEAAKGVLELKEITARLDTAQVKAAGQLALKDQGRSTIATEWKNLDLRRIGSVLGWKGAPPGVTSGRVAASFPGTRWQQAKTDAGIRVDIGKIRSRPAAPIFARLTGRLSGEQFRVRIDSLTGFGANLTGSLDFGMRDQTVAGDLRGKVESLAGLIHQLEGNVTLSSGPLLPFKIDGAAAAQARIAGSLRNPHASVDMKGAGLSAGPITGADLEMHGEYSAERFLITHARLDWHGQSATAKGEIGFASDSSPLRMQVDAEKVSLGKTARLLGLVPEEVNGTAGAKFAVTGTRSHPRVNGIFEAHGIEAYGELLGDLDAEVEWIGTKLVLNRLYLIKPQDGKNGTLTAQGSMDFDSREYEFSLAAENLQSKKLARQQALPVRGNLRLNANGQGRWDSPTATANVDLEGLRIGDEELGLLHGVLQLSGSSANLKLDDSALGLKAKADISMQGAFPVRFDFSATRFPYSRKLAGDRTARVTSELVMQGTGLLRPAEIQEFSARLTNIRLESREKRLQCEGPVEFRYAGRRLSVDRANLESGESRLRASGEIPLDDTGPPGRLILTGNFDLREIAPLFSLEGKITASGTANLNAEVRGYWPHLDAIANLKVEGASVQSPFIPGKLENLGVTVQLRDRKISVESLNAKLGEGELHASADLPLGFLSPALEAQESAPARISITAERIPIPASSGASIGFLTGSLTGELPRAELESAIGRLDVKEITLVRGSLAIERADATTIGIRDGRVQIEDWNWTGAAGKLNLAGTIGLTGDYPLDLRASGDSDAAICSLLSSSATCKGTVHADLKANGTLKDPVITGLLEIQKGSLGIQRPRVLLEDLDLKVQLDRGRFDIRQLSALLNGGRIQGSGTASFDRNKLNGLKVDLTGRDVFLEFPHGVRSSSNLRFEARSTDSEIKIGGDVEIREGSYLEPFAFSGVSTAVLPVKIETSQNTQVFGLKVRYDIGLRTLQPFEINNNLAKLSARADLRLVGDPASPGMLGTLTVDRGGKLYFAGRTYYSENGTVTFANGRRIDPVYNLLATTQVNEYQVALRLSGSGTEIATTFTSDPPLSQNDIVALLLTGKTASESGGDRVDPAQAQRLSLASGVLNADLSARMRRRFGISQVMIQPGLITGESDPGARLTVGQDLSQSLRFIYSMNLVNSADQVWYTEYDFRRRFTARATMQSDNTYRADFQQDFRFEGKKSGFSEISAAGSEKLKIGKVEYSGTPVFDSTVLARQFKITPGKKFNFAKSRKGIERLQKFYAKQGYLSARIYLDREDLDKQVNLTVQIVADKRLKIQYVGAAIPKSVDKEVRGIWQDGITDRQRADDAERRISIHFFKQGYPQAKIELQISDVSPDQKLASFHITRGVHFRQVNLVFAGATPEHADAIAQRLKQRELADEVGARPEAVAAAINLYYRERGYYQVKVGGPLLQTDPAKGTASLVYWVEEGQRLRVGTLGFQGNTTLEDSSLRDKLPLQEGSVLDPDQLKKSVEAIVEKYGENGYRNPGVLAKTSLNPTGDVADLTFVVKEGVRSIVHSVMIQGEDRVSKKYIRDQIRMSEGQPQNVPRTTQSIQDLYNTGAFSTVDVVSVPVKSALESNSGTEPLEVTIKVQEVAPYKFLYGGYYDSGRGPGGIAAIESRNILGGARVIGLRARYDASLQEGRLYFSQPMVRGHPRPITSTIFAKREADYYEGLSVERIGFTIQQEFHLQKKLVASYGYRFESVNSWYPDKHAPDPPNAIVAPLTFSVIRNTRDDFLDPTRGSFTSIAFEIGAEFLGSSYGYSRQFTQYFKYFPLRKPGYVPFQGEDKKPRVVYATGARLGLILGRTTDQVIPTERFYAGGGTTVRGFRQDTLGPLDANGDPLGGSAMLILNNELRFPVFKILDGVGFVDIGNVFPQVSDFRFSELRKTAGFGIRLRIPSLLLRFDYGFKLDRRPGESLGAFFFSIGQAY